MGVGLIAVGCMNKNKQARNIRYEGVWVKNYGCTNKW